MGDEQFINEQFIREAFSLPPTVIEYHISQSLKQLFPQKACIEVDGGYFDVESYAHAQHCLLTQKTFIHNQMTTYWLEPGPEMMHHGGPVLQGMQHDGARWGMHPNGQDKEAGKPEQETMDRAKNAWFEVQWQGATLEVLCLNWGPLRYWILADRQEMARAFLVAVCKWNTELHGEVLVFDGGRWYKDENLFQDIKGATFDNLILRGSLKQEIRDDLVQFFASRALYDEYGVPWKRGILFIGPPGNGKTHAVKALINSMEQPCLYIKSLHGVQQIFDRARRISPCIVVIEDLDSQLHPQNRSAFLNELDGFAANIGIVTLATTNHPERLDPAILDRPSRFDRKYHFELPDVPERSSYLAMWNASLKPALQLSAEGIGKISELTADFSFAYLKELFLSSMMQWITRPGQNTMEQVMMGKIATLREQMVSVSAFADSEVGTELQMMRPAMRFRGPSIR
jgi:ATPase family associated with various cellular activities (AAA)